MRGKGLLEVLEDLRVVLRASLSPGHNINVRESHVNALRTTQEWLWSDFNWPHLRVEREIVLDAGQRYYSPPTDVKVDKIERIELYLDTCWSPLTPGITGREYGLWNSDLDQRSWPPRRWRIAEGNLADGEQIEVWPTPDKSADAITREGYLRVIGIRNLRPFRDDDDRLDLDDQLVVAYTAANLLDDEKKARFRLSQATKRDARLRGAMTKRSRFSMFSIAQERRPWGRPVAVYTKPPGT